MRLLAMVFNVSLKLMGGNEYFPSYILLISWICSFSSTREKASLYTDLQNPCTGRRKAVLAKVIFGPRVVFLSHQARASNILGIRGRGRNDLSQYSNTTVSVSETVIFNVTYMLSQSWNMNKAFIPLSHPNRKPGPQRICTMGNTTVPMSSHLSPEARSPD